jgi:putative transposase
MVGLIESFNKAYWNECLKANWFLSIADAWEKIEKRREEYNMFRPQSSPGDVTPQKYAEQFECQKTTHLAGPVFG